MKVIKYISGNRFEFMQFNEYTVVFLDDGFLIQIKPGEEQMQEFIDDLNVLIKKHKKV